MTQNVKSMIKISISGLAVLLLTFLLVFGADALMNRFLQDELETTRLAAIRAEEARIAAEKSEDARLKAELAVLKAEQQETFYQTYKNREGYHYYGQYYELFNNVYNADTLFIGTSHAAHGINPKYFEEDYPDRSFFNFALNGAVPSYYLEWYHILKDEAQYPIPDTVIYCVDWFMCDTNWLWRRITFDSPADMPLGIMRALSVKKPTAEADEESTETTDGASASVPAETPASDKSLLQKIADSIKENGILDLDAHMTVFLTNTPIFSSRDRIPEMLRHFLTDEEEAPAEEAPAIEFTENEEIVIPEYEHEFLKDRSGNITSLYYRGYIPWDHVFGGFQGEVSCGENKKEWEAFNSLLDEFEEDGVNVIFLQIPEFSGASSFMRGFNNKRIAEIAENRSIPFLNYNDELLSDINDEKTNYSDWGHLNLTGSTRFSRKLRDDLKDYLPALRTDEAE
ncbi:MAG: hypothetical protein IJC71_00890 [Clostridia bacterium]|nr:hypothetical protein [Clostridia bacterium]